MTIPEVPEIPEIIKTAAQSGKLIIFVGAGASRILGCPSWIEFAKMHLELVLKAGLVNHFVYAQLKQMGEKDPRKLLTICNLLLKEPGAPKPDIKEMLKAKKESKVYEYLYSFNAVNITTNFDDHFDKQLNAKKTPPSTVAIEEGANPPEVTKADMFYKESDLLASVLARSGNITHLHGSIKDPDHLIITFPDYVKHYQPGSKASNLLQEVFKRNVLFVGYGVEEYEILEYILQKADALHGEIRHAMLYPAYKGEEDLLDHLDKYYRTLGIKLVPYSKTEKGPEQLEEVLRVWAEDSGFVAVEPMFLENSKLIDENI